MENTFLATAGWVKCRRDILSHPVSRNPRLFSLWMTLRLMASFRDNVVRTSYRALAEQVGIGASRLPEALEKLVGYGLVGGIEREGGRGIVVHISFPGVKGGRPDGESGRPDGDSGRPDGEVHSSLYKKEDIKKEKNFYNKGSLGFLEEMARVFRERDGD